MKKHIVIRLQQAGLHRWKGAPDDSYLRKLHRHVFHIELWISVSHSDREHEFMDEKTKVEQYLFDKHWDDQVNMLNFKGMSCEQIGEEILDEFTYASRCCVFEDGENGSVVDR